MTDTDLSYDELLVELVDCMPIDMRALLVFVQTDPIGLRTSIYEDLIKFVKEGNSPTPALLLDMLSGPKYLLLVNIIRLSDAMKAFVDENYLTIDREYLTYLNDQRKALVYIAKAFHRDIELTTFRPKQKFDSEYMTSVPRGFQSGIVKQVYMQGIPELRLKAFVAVEKNKKYYSWM